VRVYVEPSPAGGYFVRLRGEAAPVSRHDTEEEAEAAAAAYERGLARPDTLEHVVLEDGAEVLIRTLQPEDAPELRLDHVDREALGALAADTRALIATARYERDDERPHVALATLDVTAGWRGRGLEDKLLRRLRDRARENGIRELVE
jgi:GNAT superfamily N-acetyltransferase